MPPVTSDSYDTVALLTANIARLCAERGFTVADLERRADLEPGFLSPVDPSRVDLDHLVLITEALGLERVAELLQDR